jgi:hypothetical protein
MFCECGRLFNVNSIEMQFKEIYLISAKKKCRFLINGR